MHQFLLTFKIPPQTFGRDQESLVIQNMEWCRKTTFASLGYSHQVDTDQKIDSHQIEKI